MNTRIFIVAMVFIMIPVGLPADQSVVGTVREVKEGSKAAAKEIKSGAVETGKAFVNAGKEVKEGSKESWKEIKKGVKEVGEEFKKAYQEGKETVKKEFSGDGQSTPKAK